MSCQFVTNLLTIQCRVCRTKKERADQFSRRMHKEAPLTKHQKEEIRQKNMRERDQFDCQNLGGYFRSLPNPDTVSLNEIHAHLFLCCRIVNKNMNSSWKSRKSFGTNSRTEQSLQNPLPSPTTTHLTTQRPIRLAITKQRHSICTVQTRPSSLPSSTEVVSATLITRTSRLTMLQN